MKVSFSSGRSRSEDSVYSPASEDGGTRSEGSSDSKTSLDAATPDSQAHHHVSHHTHQYEVHQMIAHGIAALRKKRKKFSASRVSTPAMACHTTPTESVTNPIVALASKASRKQLQRASSVPTRGPEVVVPQLVPRRHDVTQSQQPSMDAVELIGGREAQGRDLANLHPCIQKIGCRNVDVCVFFPGRVVGTGPLTPSTTEESVITTAFTTGTGPPFLATKRNGSATQLQRLPGIEPISGHDVSAGWL